MKVKIKNFQSLKNVELEVKGLTILTGANNTGKSAVMRAIGGVFNNTKGHSFVRYGESHASVEIKFSDTESVLWEKGKGTNRYTINGKVFDKVGANPPDEIKEFGIHALKAGGKEVHPQLAPQFTGQVFLLDQTGSVIADCIADSERVLGLNLALKESEKEKRALSSLLKVREGDLSTLNKKLDLYEGLDEAILEVERLEEISAKRDKALRMKEWLSERQNQINTQNEAIQSLSPALKVALPSTTLIKKAWSELKWLKPLQAQIEQAKVWACLDTSDLSVRGSKNLRETHDLLCWLREAQREHANLLTKVGSYEGGVALPDTKKILKAQRIFQNLLSTQAEIRSQRKIIDEETLKLNTALAEIRGNEIKIKELQALTNNCPTCGKPMEESAC